MFFRIYLITLTVFFLARGQAFGQQPVSEEQALDIHHAARSLYIKKDSLGLEKLVDSICRIRPQTAHQQGACLECHGFEHLLWKRFEEASEAFEASAGHFAKASLPYLQAQGLNNAGWAYSRSLSSKAPLLHDQAEEVLVKNARHRRDSILLCHVYDNQIRGYQLAKNHAQEYAKAIQMLALAEQIPDTTNILSALNSLLIIYRRFDEFKDASEYLDKLCGIYQTPGGFYNPVKAVALRLLLVEHTEEANTLLQQAEQYLNAEGLTTPHPNEAEVWYNYAVAMNAFNQPDIAAQYYQKTLRVNEGQTELALFSTMFSKIHLFDIAVREKKINSSLIEEGKALLQQALLLTDLSMQAELHESLSKGYSYLQQADSAYLHLELANLLRDSIEKTSNDKQFMKSHMQYVFDKEREVQRLQQAQVEQATAAKLQRQRLLLGLLIAGLLLIGSLTYAVYRNFQLESRAARALSQANTALLSEQENLQRSNAKLERFSNVVSHDILSNLDIVLSSGRALVGSAPKPEHLLQYHQITQNTARQLKDYCLQLLQEARQKTNVASKALHDPMPILERVLKRLNPALEEAGFQLDIRPLSPAPLSPVLCEQLFQNLLSNAIRHGASAPKPILRVYETQAPSGKPAWVVEDNGPGIPPGFRESIFTHTTQSPQHGKGQQMGMALLQASLREHQTQLHLEEPPNRGARFVLTFNVNQQ